MISLCILIILILAIIFVALAIVGGLFALFIDPIICILIIIGVVKLINYFKDRPEK
jgi:hypothetical protein